VESIHARIFSTSLAVDVSPRAFIPPLFYAMGNYIPKLMVDCAVSPQAQWSEEGDSEEVTSHDVGLYQDLVCLLSKEANLKQHI
jgi:hypothetical protein